MESFFTFSDRTLRYDCPSCGSFCCKGKGVAPFTRVMLEEPTLRMRGKGDDGAIMYHI